MPAQSGALAVAFGAARESRTGLRHAPRRNGETFRTAEGGGFGRTTVRYGTARAPCKKAHAWRRIGAASA